MQGRSLRESQVDGNHFTYLPDRITSFKSTVDAVESLGLATISDDDNGDSSLSVEIDDGEEFWVVFTCNAELKREKERERHRGTRHG
jgi:hypothetical protein